MSKPTIERVPLLPDATVEYVHAQAPITVHPKNVIKIPNRMQCVTFDPERVWWMFICTNHAKGNVLTLLLDAEPTIKQEMSALMHAKPGLLVWICAACFDRVNRDAIIEEYLREVSGDWCLFENNGTNVLRTRGYSVLSMS